MAEWSKEGRNSLMYNIVVPSLFDVDQNTFMLGPSGHHSSAAVSRWFTFSADIAWDDRTSWLDVKH